MSNFIRIHWKRGGPSRRWENSIVDAQIFIDQDRLSQLVTPKLKSRASQKYRKIEVHKLSDADLVKLDDIECNLDDVEPNDNNIHNDTNSINDTQSNNIENNEVQAHMLRKQHYVLLRWWTLVSYFCICCFLPLGSSRCFRDAYIMYAPGTHCIVKESSLEAQRMQRANSTLLTARGYLKV